MENQKVTLERFLKYLKHQIYKEYGHDFDNVEQVEKLSSIINMYAYGEIPIIAYNSYINKLPYDIKVFLFGIQSYISNKDNFI